jgi:DNA-binding MarR family transcriptional regulator
MVPRPASGRRCRRGAGLAAPAPARRRPLLTRVVKDANTTPIMTRLAPDQVSRVCASVVAECACEALRRASRAVSKIYAGALADLGLTVTQLAILVATRLRGSLPLSRLAEGLGLDRTSLYRAVRPLERKGYLRTLAGRTERERVVRVTAKGERLLQEALPVWERTQQGFLDALGPGPWLTLSSALTQVRSVAQTLSSSAGARARRPRRRSSPRK